MRLTSERAQKAPSLFYRLKGLSLDAFDDLMKVLTDAYPAFERLRLARKE